MFQRILVPVDFSDCSYNALRYAALLGEKLEVDELIILHVMTLPVSYGEYGMAATSTVTIMHQEEQIETNFKKLTKVVPELKNVPHTTHVEQGYTVSAINAFAKFNKIDLIIMGTLGATGIDERIMGTNTFAVIKNSAVPVLVIPKGATYKKIEHIALASDYEPLDYKTLEPLLFLNQKFGSTLHILHVSENERIDILEAKEAKNLERHLRHVPHRFHFMVEESVEEGINRYAKDNEIGLVTLIPHKHPFFTRIFEGRQSKEIIFHTKIPLLAIPG